MAALLANEKDEEYGVFKTISNHGRFGRFGRSGQSRSGRFVRNETYVRDGQGSIEPLSCPSRTCAKPVRDKAAIIVPHGCPSKESRP